MIIFNFINISIYLFQIDHLKVLGGKNGDDIVSRILTELISNNLAKITSLTGAGKVAKCGLHKSNLQKVLYGKYSTKMKIKLFISYHYIFVNISDTVRVTKGGEDLTNSEIDGFTKKWLKNSKDREGGRNSRAIKKSQCTVTALPVEHSDDESNEKSN
jgi:hypothetical protein